MDPRKAFEQLTNDNLKTEENNAFKKLLRFSFSSSPISYFNPYNLLKNYWVIPDQINERIKAQSGVFKISGLVSKNSLLSFDTLSSRNPHEGSSRLIIRDKAGILKELADININQSSLFPDMDNVANYLKSIRHVWINKKNHSQCQAVEKAS
jgi:hypothetical protein